ncbi:hypothetical protein PC129_g23022 [Phytophthora cactorum]|uniref:Uncharacterized protein n=1 Tax=Phytophthora cactorum TaxID=29920 RepID=A0A8T1H1A6_9STRA|nr:hypothetical protein PC129_g23022 [Phytophthora cactorum]
MTQFGLQLWLAKRTSPQDGGYQSPRDRLPEIVHACQCQLLKSGHPLPAIILFQQKSQKQLSVISVLDTLIPAIVSSNLRTAPISQSVPQVSHPSASGSHRHK